MAIDEQEPHCQVCYEDDDSEIVWVEAWKMYVHRFHVTKVIGYDNVGEI